MVVLSRKVVENVRLPVVISVCKCVFLCLKPTDLLPSPRVIKRFLFLSAHDHIFGEQFVHFNSVKSGRSGEVPPINLSWNMTSPAFSSQLECGGMLESDIKCPSRLNERKTDGGKVTLPEQQIVTRSVRALNKLYELCSSPYWFICPGEL